MARRDEEVLVEDLTRLGRLHLQVRRLIDSPALGYHAARGRDGGGDFFEHRAYRSGDPMHRIDWRASARGDDLLLRQQRAERRLEVLALVDSSNSMASGEPVTKWRYGCWLGLGVTYIARRAGDNADFLVGGGTPQASRRLRATGDLEQVSDELEALAPAGPTDLAEALEVVAQRPQRGLLVVVSDLLEADDRFWRGLAEQRARGWHVAVLRVLAGDELRFEHAGAIRFDGPEGGAPVVVDAGAIRQAYLKELAQFDRDCAAEAAAAGARLILCDTEQSPIQPLRRLLEEPVR